MVRWKGYGPEHNKWVNTLTASPRTPLMPTTAATPMLPAGLPQLPLTCSPSRGTTGPSASYIRTPYSKGVGGLMSGEPPLQLLPLLSLFQPFPLWTVFRPMLQMVFCPLLWMLLHQSLCLSICLSNHPGHLSALTGTCYVIRPGTIVDTYGHVLLGSY
jgi:hypothetical protein